MPSRLRPDPKALLEPLAAARPATQGNRKRMDHTLVSRLRCAAAEAFAASPVFLAYAHGSRVRGTATESSDLDVGYHIAAELVLRC